jgi:hypothetical protein
MSAIHLPDAARVSVAEAKRLLSDAFPREDVMDVYANEAGEYHLEFKANANPQAFYLEHDFAGTCEQLGIKPRFRLRPLLTGYQGPQHDELYVITRDELAALAEFFGIAAAIPDPAPALEKAPQTDEVTQAAPAPIVHRLKNKRHVLSAFIESGKSKASDGSSYLTVWPALVKLAQGEARPPEVLGFVEGKGITYRADTADCAIKYFNKKALKAMFEREAKAR